MNIDLKGSKIAIIGGSSPCKEILEILTGPGLSGFDIEVMAVADSLKKVEGISYAQDIGITTTSDYNDLCKIKDLDIILKLKHDEMLASILEQVDTERIDLIDLDFN